MPVVFRHEGYRFYFYSHEPNEPPHVHIDRAEATAKLWLEPVALASNAGFSPRELGLLLRMTRDHQQTLLESWYGFFGRD
ncbi:MULTISPECIES: DUF4160 domain-containing protein [Bacteria]|jgi:hypothetical protein|uniref:DUF4160 domain-containing protein n=2 Tax=Acidiphilium TaxID=522 RepID=A5FUD4_ACICJ|nr:MULTISPECIES: DUF4160 domain-containing protein [Bacteria]MBW9255938.1 DUF4160 domain-containing protein [Acidithiobacillus ferriphilus]GBQ29515.1 hypothetical protein AA700_1708 [Acidiphilium acidophilum DSM 700]ABQ29216.1 hypothetical protein Acry_3624 [Acidiphilium cryptum JF-5]KDM65720.1 hypothetical protein DUF4160 [Acidiphilium sp. JA12-A1]MBS3025594.1 DUF4160 domain-containing protein [Acidiphilium multivorum]